MIEISQRRGHLCGKTGRESPAVSPPGTRKESKLFRLWLYKKNPVRYNTNKTIWSQT